MIIAIFGVVNTLALSIIERTREIGMLRAVGMLRKQVRRMIRWESIVISFFGAVTGVVLGLLLGIALQRLLVDEGITLLGIPWTLIVVVLVATGVVGRAGGGVAGPPGRQPRRAHGDPHRVTGERDRGQRDLGSRVTGPGLSPNHASAGLGLGSVGPSPTRPRGRAAA